MDGLTGDLQTKYQKLASEYSKIRAQVGVLKKAVLDEQTRNAELRDTFKEREQSLRKADQEMDSLTFRNQQLTKRVTVLQDELEALSKVKKGKLKLDHLPDSTSDVMGEEFHKTITENAKLLSLLQDKEEAHRQDIEHLTQRIEHLEHKLQHQNEQHKRAVAKLEAEKASALATAVASPASIGSSHSSQSTGHSAERRSKADSHVESLQRSNAELTAHARELNSQRLQLTSQLEDATRIIRSHLPFVDSSDRELNELNIPQHDRGQQAHAFHIVSLAGTLVEELAKSFEEMHSHVRQRLLVLQGALSPLNVKFAEHLQDSGRQLHHLKQGYTEFQQGLEGESWSLDMAPSLIALSRPLHAYSLYLQKLQPYQKLSMEEECILLGASEELHSASRDVVARSAHLCVQIAKISGYVRLLAGQSRRPSQHPVRSQQRFLKELTTSLQSLHKAIQDLLCAYTVKFALEQEGEGKVAEEVRPEGEAILGALTSAVSSSGKLADVLEGGHFQLDQGPQFGTQAHPAVTNFHKRAAQYLSSLDQEEAPSVPYEEALLQRAKVRSGLESCRALTVQMAEMQEQTAQAEREREQWHQEYHLLLLRKEQEEGSSARHTVDSSDGDGAKTVISNLLGKITTPFIPSSEVEAREQHVKEYFQGRMNELIAFRHIAESKAITYMSECAVLKARLEDAVQGQKFSEERVSKLSEELATTTQGYDSQLAVMSEHLANMNEKLALQRDTIDQLKYQQIQTKGLKKGKQK